ncbi:MAG: PQQ-binding-like beta-propeller repeat protein [Zavarzinella sp.]
MFRVSCLAVVLTTGTLLAADWPQWLGPNRDSQWKESGILAKFPAGGPKKVWSQKISGGYSGPAVADGKVFVTDYVRTAGDAANNPSVMAASEGTERVLCLDAATGKELWKYEYACKYKVSYPAGPRCTPTVSGKQVFILGAMGHLNCLDVETGKVIWSKDFVKDYQSPVPMWGFTGHPLVHKDTLYCLVGGRGSLIVAFDRNTGKEKWKALDPGATGYSAPNLIQAGGTEQLVVWHPKAIVSLNPETGSKNWDVSLEPLYEMSIMSPMIENGILYAGGIGGVAVGVKLDDKQPTAKELWRGKKTTSVSPVNSNPILHDGIIYSMHELGNFVAADLKTGKRLWSSMKPLTGKEQDDFRINSGTVFMVKNGSRYFLFAETGELIIANLSAKGYEEIDRTKLIDTTHECFGRKVIWSHPAFANKSIYLRNDNEIICYSLAE